MAQVGFLDLHALIVAAVHARSVRMSPLVALEFALRCGSFTADYGIIATILERIDGNALTNKILLLMRG